MDYRNGPKNRQESTYPTSDPYSDEMVKETKISNYKSYSGSVSLTQPIFDYEAYSRYQMGKVNTLMTTQKYRSKVQDLASRVTVAYISVVNAREQLALSEAQEKAYQAQLISNRHFISAGEGTITDLAETQARLSLTVAEKIEAQDALDFAERELEAIIGHPLKELSEIPPSKSGGVKIQKLVPGNFNDWKNIALANNPTLQAARYDMESKKKQIEINRSSFMPKVELYATHAVNESSSETTINQRYRTNSMGVQVSMNLFSGGGDAANLRQSAALYGQSMYEYDAKTNTLLNDLRKQYNIYQSSGAKITAYQYAVMSAQEQLKATEKGVLYGQRVNTDVLNSLQILFKSKKDLAESNYAFIKANVSLLVGAGTLNEKDMMNISLYL